MTAFEFMAAAFYALVGVACLAAAVVIAYMTFLIIYKGIKGGGQRGKN